MARLDDTSDPTSQNWVDSYNPPASADSGSSNAQSIDYGGGWNAAPVSYASPYFGGSVPSPAAEQSAPNSWYGGSVPSPQQYYQPAQQTFYQPGYQTGGGGGGGMAAAAAPYVPPPVVHHNAAFYRDNGQAATDVTYQNQKAALVGKLNDYQRNVAGQIGDQNLTHVDDPGDLLGFHYDGKALGKLYTDTQDANGDDHYAADPNALGGTLGKDYSTNIANFDNQQANGLRNVAEDFASRGMLGSGSGVWQTARNNAQDQYRQQLSNFNDSTANQYNTLLGNLADQFSQARPTLTGYLTDASNRMATADALNLPTSV